MPCSRSPFKTRPGLTIRSRGRAPELKRWALLNMTGKLPRLFILSPLIFVPLVFSEAPVYSLMELFEMSDFVGMVKVERIEMVNNKKYAIARVNDVWKGTKAPHVRFRAYPTWICDTSSAKVGQYGLTFLEKEDNGYAITNSGQGSLRIVQPSRITKDGIVLYSISEYDLLTAKERSTLTSNSVDNKENQLREVTFPQLKQLLQRGLTK
jgi:hypothetical protein